MRATNCCLLRLQPFTLNEPLPPEHFSQSVSLQSAGQTGQRTEGTEVPNQQSSATSSKLTLAPSRQLRQSSAVAALPHGAELGLLNWFNRDRKFPKQEVETLRTCVSVRLVAVVVVVLG